MTAVIPGESKDPLQGFLVQRGVVKGRPWALYSDGKVLYRAADGREVVFTSEQAFRGWVGVPKERQVEARPQPVEDVTGIIGMMLLGACICGFGLLVTFGTYEAARSGAGGRYIVMYGAILIGGGMFLINLLRLAVASIIGRMLLGACICGLGLLITYEAGLSAGREWYIVMYGAILIGGGMFLTNLLRFAISRPKTAMVAVVLIGVSALGITTFLRSGLHLRLGPGVAILGVRHKLVASSDGVQCAAVCREDGGCTAYQYNAESKLCDLFRSVSSTVMVPGYYSGRVRW